MEARTTTFLVFTVLALVGAAGCVEPGAGLYLGGASGIPTDAPQHIGDGDVPVQIKVLKESGQGEAIIGAPVAIYHIPKPHAAPSTPELMRKNATLGGRTGPDGILTARLDAGQTYSFVTHVPNWTQEIRHLVKITDQHRSQPVTIVVFSLNASKEYAGKVPMVLRADVPIFYISGTVRWWPQDVKFHEDPASNREYLFRARAMEATMRFDIPPGAYAPLMMRAVLQGETGQPVIWDAYGSGILSVAGTAQARLRLEAADLAHVAKMKNPTLRIGPMVYDQVLTPQCIPWSLTTDFVFDTTPIPPARRLYTYYGTAPDTFPPVPMNC